MRGRRSLVADDTRTRVFVGLATDTFANDAVAAVEDIRELAEISLRESPLEDATVRVTGITAFFDAVDATADADLRLLVVTVLLVALGADDNISLMSRVREEAETKPTRQAVADVARSTGGAITSAGLILAGTFVVRSLLAPSLATLLGRHHWWPSRRSRAAAEGG